MALAIGFKSRAPPNYMTTIKSKLVPSIYNFYPNYANNMVEVILGNWIFDKYTTYYICIRGLDDIAVISEDLSYEEAENLFNSMNKIGDKEIELFRGSEDNNGWPSKMTTIDI